MAMTIANSDAEFLGHQSCPKCESSDALGVYSDGHGFCFSCQTHFKEVDNVEATANVVSYNRPAEMYGQPMAMPERRISLDTVKKYGVTVETVPNGHEAFKHHYPYYDNGGKFIGTKARRVSDKSFSTSGNMKDNTLFGQQLFKNEGRFVTVVEGELDALAAFEMLGSKFPVVSVSKGAAGAVKDFKQNLEWLEGFENVVIAFDNDTAGREAADKCAQVLSPNKARIVTMSMFKDASDYLTNNKIRDFTNEWWEAKPYRITGVITLEDAWSDFIKRGTEEIIPFPESFGMLNSMMNGGIAAGEITVLGALTSIGKTTMVNELVYHFWKNTNKNIGCAFLEASKGEAVENLLTIHTGHNLSLEDRKNIDFDKLHTDIITDGRILLLDHHGAVDSDELFIKLRAMVKGSGCEILVIDPLQAAVTSNANETIDDFMDRLLKLAKETDVSIIVVSHMRKPSLSNPHNVNEYDLKGSGSINQIAFNTILLSRDKMSEDEYARNSTMVQVVKCRRTGLTGMAGWLYYNSYTGRLERGEAPEQHAAGEEDEF
jgi:twinkle protein